MLLYLRLELILHVLMITLFVGPGRTELGLGLVHDNVRADIGRQDQDAISEIDMAPEAVGKLPLLHYLQEHIIDVRMGLFDLVKEHDRVGPATDLLGQLATFLETDVTGRGSHQPRDIVLLHVFRHIDLDERILFAEGELGQGLGKEGLSDPGRPQEEKRAHGAEWIFQT